MLHMRMDVEPYLELLNKSTGGNVHVNVTHVKIKVEPYLKQLNKSTEGNVSVNVTHENGCRAIHLKLY
jgi:hypothetical protein